jgi:hypothetical protein
MRPNPSQEIISWPRLSRNVPEQPQLENPVLPPCLSEEDAAKIAAHEVRQLEIYGELVRRLSDIEERRRPRAATMRGDISPVGSAAGWRDVGAPTGHQPGAPCVQAVLRPRGTGFLTEVLATWIVLHR